MQKTLTCTTASWWIEPTSPYHVFCVCSCQCSDM